MKESRGMNVPGPAEATKTPGVNDVAGANGGSPGRRCKSEESGSLLRSVVPAEYREHSAKKSFLDSIHYSC